MDSRDPGLQPERTALAWQRTQITVVAFFVAVVKAVTLSSWTGAPWLLALGWAVVVTIVVLCLARYAAPASPLAQSHRPDVLSLSVTVLALLIGVNVLTH